jgi:acetolactate synthase I/II/III large subunit
MWVHQAIVAVLRDVGVDVIFGGAGEESMGMQIAVAQAEGVRGIIPKHEQNASFMACGYALFSGKLGVCFATAGPGAFNLMSGVCVALNGSLPRIAITGYATMAYDGRGQANETSGLVRTPDSRMVWDAVVKKDPATGKPANYLITKVEDVVPIMHRAVEVALTGRPGPVQVAVAWNITAPTLEVANYSPPRIDRRPVAPDPAEIESAAAFLAEAIGAGKQTAVLWAGYGAIRAGAGPEVRAFMERYQVPLVTTMDGKGIVAEDHPLAMGLFCESGHKSAAEVFLASDVVVALGNSFSQYGTFDFRPDLFENRKLVYINVDPEELAKYYKANYGIVGDAKLAMAALLTALDGRVGPVKPRSFRTSAFDLEKAAERVAVDVTPKIHPGRMIEAISRMLPERGVVIADVGVHMAWTAYYLALRDGQNFHKPPSYGPMALGASGALGVKCAEPDRTVIATVGDGCYLMSGFELTTAVQHNIAVIWVIFNDGEYKLIKLSQLGVYKETALISFDNPDFVAYAHACGADGYAVDTQDGFEKALAAALASGRPTLIDAKISRVDLPHYSENPEGVLASIWDRLTKRNLSRHDIGE